MRLDELLADHRACGVTRRGCLRKGEPCTDQQRLDRAYRCPERARQVGIRHPRQLAHQQSRSLLIGQPAYVLNQPTERVAQIDLRQRVM
jgi:hypothetical protein